MLTLRHSLVLTGLILAVTSCGDQDTTSGFADPCDTPMAGVLGCPARSGYPGKTFTASDACRKLVSCGILAAANYTVLNTTRPCAFDSDCAASSGEACKKASDGRLWCHTPVLDQRWCFIKLSQGGADPCDRTRTFSAQHINGALQCIADTKCEALGLPFSDKVLSKDRRPQMDLFVCEKPKNHIWTATLCDHGLLQY